MKEKKGRRNAISEPDHERLYANEDAHHFLLYYRRSLYLRENIYDKGIASVRYEISNSMVTHVSESLNKFEADIVRIKSLEYNMINNKKLIALAAIPESLSTYNQIESMLNVQNDLLSIKESSPYISDVSVHIPAIGKTISAINSVNPLQVDAYKKLSSMRSDSGSQLKYINGQPVLNLVFPLGPLSSKKSPQFVLDIRLSNTAIEQNLLNSSTYRDTLSLLTDSKSNFMLSNVQQYSLKDRIGEIMAIVKSKPDPNSNSLSDVTIAGKRYIYVYDTSEYLNMTFTRLIPYGEVFQSLNQHKTWLWTFTAFSFLVLALYTMWAFKTIHQPLRILVWAFRKVEKGDFKTIITNKKGSEFGYLFQRFNEMVGRLNLLIDQVYVQTILAQRAELKQLQSQINPHFLYNSFFILHRRIQNEDYENAITFSQQLGNYFRFITRSGSDEVHLALEVDHARTYADIQATRFANRITVSFEELPDNIGHILVPRLIIQPILENAYEYGLENRERDGQLFVRFEEANGNLAIIVEDNGNELGDEKLYKLQQQLTNSERSTETTGLINIHRRIRLKFGEDSGIIVTRSWFGGLKVLLRLPIGE